MSLYIQHVGIIGMKWGQHKANMAAYKSKVENLSKTATNVSDKRRFSYAKDPIHKRLGKTAIGAAISVALGTVITAAMTGKNPDFSKVYSMKGLKRVAQLTAQHFITNEVLARSAASKYDSSGKLVKSNPKKSNHKTKEDYADQSIKIAQLFYPGVRLMAQKKLISVLDARRANKDIFDKWGPNILSEKVSNVVWQSPDLKTAVINDSPVKGWH